MAPVSLGDNTFTSVWLIGNGQGGFSSDPSVGFTGTLTWNQPIVEWNGCEEAYPLSGGIDNPSNYSNCTGEDGTDGNGANKIIADGIAFGANGNENAGNWNITGPGSISFNTQDGLDTLHGTGNGLIQIDKMRFEGNGSNQVKINAQSGSVTNSIIIADCGWWYGASQTISGGMQWEANPQGSCRAYGNPITYVTSAGGNNVYTFYNNTIFGNGDVVFNQNGGCDNTDTLNIKNNIIYGGYDWYYDTFFNSINGDNRLTTYNYIPNCSNMVVNEDYNLVTGTKNNNQGCNGDHDKCGSSPSFIGTLPIGAAGGGPSTYYQGQQAVTLVGISVSNQGTSGLSYWNTENDYYNVTRPSPPLMGALEVNSCGASGYLCFYNSDCCSKDCSNNACTGSPPPASGIPVFSISGKTSLNGRISL